MTIVLQFNSFRGALTTHSVDLCDDRSRTAADGGDWRCALAADGRADDVGACRGLGADAILRSRGILFAIPVRLDSASLENASWPDGFLYNCVMEETALSSIGKSDFRIVDKKRPELVPESSAKDEKADDQGKICDQTPQNFVLNAV